MQINVYTANKQQQLIMKTIFIVCVLFLEMLNASDKDYLRSVVENNIFAQEFLKSDILKDLQGSPKSNPTNNGNVKQLQDKKQQEIQQAYNQFIATLESFDEGKYFKPLIDEAYFKKLAELNKKQTVGEFTIFLFTSESVELENINNFMLHIEKLSNYYPNVRGKIMLQGYPSFYNNKIMGRLANITNKQDIKINNTYGLDIVLHKDGSYEISNNRTLESDMIFDDEENLTVPVSDKLNIEVVAAKNKKTGEYYFKQEMNPGGMLQFMNKVKSFGKVSDKIDIHVHPWAFDYFKLRSVPAFAYSYCQEDFSFKECEHKYLIKGNITLLTFFEIASKHDNSLNEIYFNLIKDEK